MSLKRVRTKFWSGLWLAVWLQLGFGAQFISAANVMNYGADGNDYFQFTTPSLAFDKASGFTTLITFAMHVDADGTLEIGGGPVCSNGVYVGPGNWSNLVNTLKAAPTTVTRYEVCVGGWLDTSYDNIKSLIASQGTGTGSMLYRNFLALKNAVPGIDAINDDDEKTYDVNSTVGFANLLGGLGYKFTTAPYTAQNFWVNVNNSVTNCDAIYLQCYSGGAGNDPAQWNTAFGHGVKVIPGQESNTANPAAFRSWYLATGAAGGFYYPDILFASTYWSAAIIQAAGTVPTVPTGLNIISGGSRVKLSWDVVPGAIAYNVKRSAGSGGEVTIGTISTANTAWPASNQFFDALPAAGVINYYKVSAINTNGESVNSAEVSVTPPTVAAWFKADAISSANGGGVAIWPDSSGRGFSAIQTTVGQRPTYMTSALNGLPVVHFNGANNQILALNRPIQDDFTIFCVFRSSQGLSSGTQFSESAGLVSANAAGVANDFGAGLFAGGQICAGAGNPDASISSAMGFNDGQSHVLTFKRTKSSGELDLYVDGNFVGRTTGNTASLNASAKLVLGAQQTLENYFSGDLAEVKMYSAALSDADQQTQETSLAQKWGVASAAAGLLAYDGFNYPAGNILSGQFGGIGWSNGWVDVSGNASETIIPGLLTGENALSGFDNRSLGNAAHVGNNSRSGRWLDCSTNGNFALAGYVNASGNIGASGKILYLSFLQQASSPAQFYEFELHRGDLGDPGRIAGVGNDSANATTVNLRVPGAAQTPFAAGNTNVNFYVVRIDYHGGNDDVYIYRNPTGASEADNAAALTMLGAGDMSFNGLSFGAYLNDVTVSDDEIRLGQTWASVLGNPPVFVVQPMSQTVYAGQNAQFTALAQSSQPLNYQWYRIIAGITNALTGQTNANLIFTGGPGDAGTYFVLATNALGMATSAQATLSAQIISVALTSSSSIPIGPGSNVVLNAAVDGVQPLTLQWYKDGAAIADATNAAFAMGADGFFDAGQYVLTANNTYGSATSSIVNVFPNWGGLLVYEGFNYGQSNSDIGGASGGFGWAGAWVNVAGGSSQTYSNNLSAGANAPAGYDARSLNGYLSVANASRKGRYLDCSVAGALAQHGYVDGNGNLGANGTTIYLSFLQQPNALAQFYEFELKRGDLGDGGRLAGIGNDTTDDHVHLRIESPAGGSSTFYDLGLGTTNVNFYVLRMDYRTGNDTVTVYRNPSSATEPTVPTLTVSNIADMSFDGVSLAAYLNNLTVAHDEVRLGMAWSDVVGNTVSELQLTQRTNQVSSLLLAGSPNYNYQVQAATNLFGPWTNLGTVTTPILGVSLFVETNVNSSQRFYRALNGTVTLASSSTDTVITDFEQPTYGTWVTTGTAFGSGPAQGTLPNQQTVGGYQGSGLVDSFHGGDPATGTLTSPPLVITKPYLDFLIGGGNLPGQECLNLIVSNVIVKTATGANSETLTAQQWDVSAYLGQTATLQIVDTATGGWGHINVDQIVLSDTVFPSLSRTLWLTNGLLNLPVKNGATMKRVTVVVGGNPVRDFNIELADGVADWWAFVDVSAFSNQTATVSVSSLAPGSTGLSSIVQTNGIVGATNLYQEALRPQIHFATKRGWLNDANGMFYYHGQYHLYYQHDPFNWDGSGQKWWGHAVSTDMLNWQELPEGIYSHTYGDDVWSGSAVVDASNTGGFKTGTNDVIVAAFYSTARGECIAYSNDGGVTFTDYINNPVVVHTGTGRDPHIFWYAPLNYWVMAVYDDAGGNGVQFYSTPDFRHWTFRSKIYNGFFECPDIFPLPVDGDTNNVMWELNDASSGYQLGQFDGATFTPSTAKLPGNSGADYYASQTFTGMAPGDNRKVRICWAQISTPGMPFNQLMYFPTALGLTTTANGVRLCSTPITEITNNAINIYSWTNLTLSPGNNPLSGIRGKAFDVKAQFAAGSASAVTFTFQGVVVTYNAANQQINCNGDTQSLPFIGGKVQLEIVVDRDTIEIFGNNGQLYMPLPANNASGNSLISLTCAGGNVTFNSLTVNELKSIWTGLSQR
ncbi:MAG TPA: LamG-like jellyroll fold domain-containing protein [Verrucomicrobiae bacterium]